MELRPTLSGRGADCSAKAHSHCGVPHWRGLTPSALHTDWAAWSAGRHSRDESLPTIRSGWAYPASQDGVPAREIELRLRARAFPPGCDPPGPAEPRSRGRSPGCAIPIIQPCGPDSLRSSRYLTDKDDSRCARAIAPSPPSSSLRRKSQELEGPAHRRPYEHPSRNRPGRAAGLKDARSSRCRNRSGVVTKVYLPFKSHSVAIRG